jgi:hypothetical protein
VKARKPVDLWLAKTKTKEACGPQKEKKKSEPRKSRLLRSDYRPARSWFDRAGRLPMARSGRGQARYHRHQKSRETPGAVVFGVFGQPGGL